MMRTERRTFRLSCHAPVIVKAGGRAGEDRGAIRGQTANVSMEGAAIVLPQAIQPGSSVAVVFLPSELPSERDASGEALGIQKDATVAWVRRTPDYVSFRHGLRFAEPETDLLLRAWPGQRLPE